MQRIVTDYLNQFVISSSGDLCSFTIFVNMKLIRFILAKCMSNWSRSLLFVYPHPDGEAYMCISCCIVLALTTSLSSRPVRPLAITSEGDDAVVDRIFLRCS